MKILFLMLQMPEENKGGGMYVNLAEEFVNRGHEVHVMAPDNNYTSTYRCCERGMDVVRVGSIRTQGEQNMIKKGFALALMPIYYKRAYKKYYKNEKFDWILMPTPPITLIDLVKYAKNRSGAKFYLILRDIHPQSINSLGLIKHKFMYDYLEKRARAGYEIADLIGCMSQQNINFIRINYPNINPNKLVLLYNWLDSHASDDIDFNKIRKQHNLQGKIIALFGGTIGKGQRIENIEFLAEHYKSDPRLKILIIGKGVEKDRLMTIAKERNLDNIVFMDFLPQKEYMAFMSHADIGLVSISELYKVPTCPSKAVAYMALGIPVFAIINPDNDYGKIIEQSGAGYYCVGTDREMLVNKFDMILNDENLRKQMSESGKRFYQQNLTTKNAVTTIENQTSQV